LICGRRAPRQRRDLPGVAGVVVELLGRVLANALHLAAIGAEGGFGLVMGLGAGKLGSQGFAFGLSPSGVGLAGELLQFLGHGRQVGIGGFLEQLGLLGGPAFRLHAEAITIHEHSDLRTQSPVGRVDRVDREGVARPFRSIRTSLPWRDVRRRNRAAQ
jgi:hypothetical protein